MFKLKAAALIATLTISTAANAGLAIVGLQNITYADGATLSGYFVQDETTRAIMHWSLHLNMPQATESFRFIPELAYGQVTQAYVSSYAPAPTNFTVFQHSKHPHVDAYFAFAATDNPGKYQVSGAYRSTPAVSSPYYPEGQLIFIETGTAVYSAMTAEETQRFNDMCAEPFVCIAPFVPQELPEPGSIVLLGLAAAGLYSVRRRKVA